MGSTNKGLVTGTSSKKGEFVRAASSARSILDTEEFPWQENRYCLYIADACGWAHRVHSTLHLLNIQSYFNIAVVHPTWARTKEQDDTDQHHGWCFANKDEVVIPPALKDAEHANTAVTYKRVSWRNGHVDKYSGLNARYLRDIYEAGGSAANVFSTPMIYDPVTGKVVNNESGDICRMLNDIAHKYYGKDQDIPQLYPADQISDIEALNEWMYPMLNNGVYRCGFAKTQEAYDMAAKDLKTAMCRLEEILKEKHKRGETFLCGNVLTIADVRAFTHLIRLDEIYVVWFKIPFASLLLYPNIFSYTARLLAIPAFQLTTNVEDMRLHCFTSHKIMNPLAIVPASSGVFELLLKQSSRIF